MPKENTVTLQDIADEIDRIHYWHVPGTTSTVCAIQCKNGFVVIGDSACVDPKNYDERLGRSYAKDEALGKLRTLIGFRLADKIHNKQQLNTTKRNADELEYFRWNRYFSTHDVDGCFGGYIPKCDSFSTKKYGKDYFNFVYDKPTNTIYADTDNRLKFLPLKCPWVMHIPFCDCQPEFKLRNSIVDSLLTVIGCDASSPNLGKLVRLLNGSPADSDKSLCWAVGESDHKHYLKTDVKCNEWYPLRNTLPVGVPNMFEKCFMIVAVHENHPKEKMDDHVWYNSIQAVSSWDELNDTLVNRSANDVCFMIIDKPNIP
jgi:hypothetical protein